jgi:hypothetical protein
MPASPRQAVLVGIDLARFVEGYPCDSITGAINQNKGVSFLAAVLDGSHRKKLPSE